MGIHGLIAAKLDGTIENVQGVPPQFGTLQATDRGERDTGGKSRTSRSLKFAPT
jgi:hypothetical protein